MAGPLMLGYRGVGVVRVVQGGGVGEERLGGRGIGVVDGVENGIC